MVFHTLRQSASDDLTLATSTRLTGRGFKARPGLQALPIKCTSRIARIDRNPETAQPFAREGKYLAQGALHITQQRTTGRSQYSRLATQATSCTWDTAEGGREQTKK